MPGFPSSLRLTQPARLENLAPTGSAHVVERQVAPASGRSATFGPENKAGMFFLFLGLALDYGTDRDLPAGVRCSCEFRDKSFRVVGRLKFYAKGMLHGNRISLGGLGAI